MFGYRVAAALALSCGALTLGGCQTGPSYEYRQIAPGPDLETALAYCRMQGLMGTPGNQVVFGPGIQHQVAAMNQNAANLEREKAIIRLCMRSQGYALFEIAPVA